MKDMLVCGLRVMRDLLCSGSELKVEIGQLQAWWKNVRKAFR